MSAAEISLDLLKSWPCAAAVGAGVIVGYRAAHWYFSRQLGNKDSLIELLQKGEDAKVERRVAAVRAALEEATLRQIEDLQSQLVSKDLAIAELQRSEEQRARIASEQIVLRDQIGRLQLLVQALGPAVAPRPAITLLPAAVKLQRGARLPYVSNAMAHPSHDIRAINIAVDGVTVCRQTFASPLGTIQGIAQIRCPVETDTSDPALVPLYSVGTHSVVASLIDGTGAVVAAAKGQLEIVEPEYVNR